MVRPYPDEHRHGTGMPSSFALMPLALLDALPRLAEALQQLGTPVRGRSPW